MPSSIGILYLHEIPITVRAAMKTKDQNKLKSLLDLTIVLSQCIKPRLSEMGSIFILKAFAENITMNNIFNFSKRLTLNYNYIIK